MKTSLNTPGTDTPWPVSLLSQQQRKRAVSSTAKSVRGSVAAAAAQKGDADACNGQQLEWPQLLVVPNLPPFSSLPPLFFLVSLSIIASLMVPHPMVALSLSALLAFTIALPSATAESVATPTCQTFYPGLCPGGTSSCQCTLNEPCSAVDDVAYGSLLLLPSPQRVPPHAQRPDGSCAGQCLQVVTGQCPARGPTPAWRVQARASRPHRAYPHPPITPRGLSR